MKKCLLILCCLALMVGCADSLDITSDLNENDVLKSAKVDKKPLPSLTGITSEFFSPATFPFVWVGTIDFSATAGYGMYGLAYELLEFPRDFSNAGHFVETFYVYEGDDWNTGVVLLKGTNEGVIVGGEKFTTNGTVAYAAAPFEAWLNRSVHVKGEVVAIDEASGMAIGLASTFRLN